MPLKTNKCVANVLFHLSCLNSMSISLQHSQCDEILAGSEASLCRLTLFVQLIFTKDIII